MRAPQADLEAVWLQCDNDQGSGVHRGCCCCCCSGCGSCKRETGPEGQFPQAASSG